MWTELMKIRNDGCLGFHLNWMNRYSNQLRCNWVWYLCDFLVLIRKLLAATIKNESTIILISNPICNFDLIFVLKS